MDELCAAELDEFARQLYAAFNTGWDFEEFIKLLFIAMGLDDVTVTSRTRDGGIDLTALRRGVEGLSIWTRSSTLRKQSATSLIPPQSWWTSGHSVASCRQAARASPSPLDVTRRMRASSPRRISPRPILLLDGRAVVQLCIDHGLGFRSRPVFDSSRLRGQLRGASSGPSAPPPQSVHDLRIMRTITANDIRARIIRVPGKDRGGGGHVGWSPLGGLSADC